MIKVIKDPTYGISFETDKFLYELDELISYKGHSSSDIVVLMIATKDEGYVGMLNFSFGSFDEEGIIKWAKEEIERYEKGLIEPIELC